MTFDPTYVQFNVSCDRDFTKRIIVSNSRVKYMYVDTVTIFQKLNEKFKDLNMTFDPTSVEVKCVTLPNHCDCIQVTYGGEFIWRNHLA